MWKLNEKEKKRKECNSWLSILLDSLRRDGGHIMQRLRAAAWPLVAVVAAGLPAPSAAQAQGVVSRAIAADLIEALAGAGARRIAVSGVVRSASESRAIARAARYCVRSPGEPACLFKRSATPLDAAREAMRDVIGNEFRVRQQSPSLFEILDAANNVVSILEVLDRHSHPGFDDLPAWEPSTQQQHAGTYQVACGPGYAPLPYTYNNNPQHFGHWSCSNGPTHYNAAGACQPGKQGWRVWDVEGHRLLGSSACP